MSEKEPEIGVLVKIDDTGEFSKRGIIYRVIEIDKRDKTLYNRYAFTRYKVKPVWGLFGAHKRKRTTWVMNLKVIDLIDLGQQSLQLQDLIRGYVKERSER